MKIVNKIYDNKNNCIGQYTIPNLYDIEKYNIYNSIHRIRSEVKKYKDNTYDIISVKSNGLTTGNKIKQLINHNIGFIRFSKYDFSGSSPVFILPSRYDGDNNGLNILKKHFNFWCIYFSINKLVKVEWYNNQFPFLEPNIKHEKYSEFKSDCVLFTLFNSNNNASSIKLEYDNKIYDVKNHFFWMTRKEFSELNNIPLVIYNHMNLKEPYTWNDPWAARWIQLNEHKLSTEALDLLNAGRELVRVTMEDRLNTDPYFQLRRWDAGFGQIRKGLLENKNLNNKYSELYKDFKYTRKILNTKCKNTAMELGCYWEVELFSKNNGE